MRTMRIALATILIIGFIGIIPRSWSWADSHTETPAASESTNNMSSEEKCKEENYKRFEQCMIPCHKDNREENYYKALKLYGKPTTFEGTDIVITYCMKVCNEKIRRIDCSITDEDSTRCKEQQNSQEEINNLWKEYYNSPDPNPLIAAKESREETLKRFTDSLYKPGINIDKWQREIDKLQLEIDELLEEIQKRVDHKNKILDIIYGRAPRIAEKGSCAQEGEKDPDRSVVNQLKTFGKGGLLLRIDENNTLIIVVIPKKTLDLPKEIRVAVGNLLAIGDERTTPREQKPYAAPKDIADVKTVLTNEVTTIEDAYAYLQKARRDFPIRRELNDRSSNMERQVERAMERQRGELLDLESYFGVLSNHLDNAQWWLRKAVATGIDENAIHEEIRKRNKDFMAVTISDTREKIKDTFRHLNFTTAMNQYLDQLRSPDPSTELIGQALEK